MRRHVRRVGWRPAAPEASSPVNAEAITAPLLRYRQRPIGFLLHYVRRHASGHAVVLGAVLAAVAFSVTTQYGLKRVIDVVSHGPQAAGGAVWGAFAVLCVLIRIGVDDLFPAAFMVMRRKS